MLYHVKFPSGEEHQVDVKHLPTGELRVTVEGRTFDADLIDSAGSMNLRFDGRVVDLVMEGSPPEVGVVARGLRFYAQVESDRMRETSASTELRAPHGSGLGLVTSPMPGRVLKVLVAEGDVVTTGTPLVVVEAMKMENELVALKDGTVEKIYVAPGATVESGASLAYVS